MTQMASENNINSAELNAPLNGRYQVIEILSARLWSRTYLAQDLHRPSQSERIIHHLKTIPIVPNYADVIRGLFSREAVILEQLGTHTQIPQLLAWFEDEQGFYVVQEYVSGQPLTQELQTEPAWDEAKVLQFLRDVLDPLAWVHRHGSMHGNLKPENLLRRHQDRRYVLIDLGSMNMLQKAFMAAHGLFVPPSTAAQQGYQPLEQLQGLPCAASDVYAVGMLAVQALTGIKPTEFKVDPDTVEILWKEYVKPSTSPLHQGLISVLDNMVQWDLPRRYANADQVLLALQDAVPLMVSSEVKATTRSAIAVAMSKVEVPVAVTNTTPQPVVSRAIAEAIPVQAVAITNGKQLEADSSRPQPTTPKPQSKPSEPSNQPNLKPKWRMQDAIANPTLRYGAGGVAVATTFAAVGWGLLNSVDWSQKAGAMWNRMAQAGDKANKLNGLTLKAQSGPWRKEWQAASIKYQQAEAAFNRGDWAKVKELATNLSTIPYWRDRGTDLVKQVGLRTESNSTERLQQAFEYAKERRFTNALKELGQIATGSPADNVVQAKTKEYREKQNIKAWFDLQQAYDRAVAREFVEALAYLYQIPEGTAAYPIAQTKIAEYKQKEKVRVKTLLRTEDDRVKQQYLVASLSSLETLSSDTENRGIVTTQIEAYINELNQHAEIWLQKAAKQEQAGYTAAAIATLENVPIGTPAYAQARDRILELTAKLHPAKGASQSITSQTRPSSQTLNPGEQLREPQPFIIGRADLRFVK